jgi:hypothetical protein
MVELTDKQLILWKLKQNGLGLTEIASLLRVSRQAVHKGLQSVETKIYRALIDAAKANRIEIRKIDTEKGFLAGWSPEFRVDVIVTFSAKNGIQVWYRHKGDCKSCSMREECKAILLSEAEERGITLPDDEPSRLAEVMFKELLGR